MFWQNSSRLPNFPLNSTVCLKITDGVMRSLITAIGE